MKTWLIKTLIGLCLVHYLYYFFFFLIEIINSVRQVNNKKAHMSHDEETETTATKKFKIKANRNSDALCYYSIISTESLEQYL